jgi:hypothetical protein
MIDISVGGKLELLVVKDTSEGACEKCVVGVICGKLACCATERKDGENVHYEIVDQVGKVDTQDHIVSVFNSMRNLVLEKNKRYGDAALTPKQVFSKLDAVEGLKIRLDDKISRIMNNGGEIRKNDVADIMGYLVLLAISQNWLDFSDLID